MERVANLVPVTKPTLSAVTISRENVPADPGFLGQPVIVWRETTHATRLYQSVICRRLLVHQCVCAKRNIWGKITTAMVIKIKIFLKKFNQEPLHISLVVTILYAIKLKGAYGHDFG